MLRTLAILACLAPAAALADDFVTFDGDRPNQFLPVYPSGQGGFTVGRRVGLSGVDYFCRAGQWARTQGASYTDRVAVVRSSGGGVSFRIVSGGASSGGVTLGARAGESRSVGHALALCG